MWSCPIVFRRAAPGRGGLAGLALGCALTAGPARAILPDNDPDADRRPGLRRAPVPRAARLLLLAGLVSAAGAARLPAGGIRYDAASNCLVVAGFPEEQPATLADLLDADRRHGWGCTDYEPAGDTVTLRASLAIGSTNDTGTFFQIGTPAHPRETLVLHGNLTVLPPRPSGRPIKAYTDWAGNRPDGRYRISNRLTLGVFGEPAIRPTLKMACSVKNEFAVTVGFTRLAESVPYGERWYPPIGELYMAHATLTAATPDAEHTYRASISLSHMGVNYRLRESTISWWDQDLFQAVFIAVRPLGDEAMTLRGMVFEHGGNAGGPFHAVDCMFRDLARARLTTMNMATIRCRFEQVPEAIYMPPSHLGAILTDCTFGPGADRPARIPRSERGITWLRTNGIYKDVPALAANPGLIERVSLVARVQDERGRPVPRAAVQVSCRNDPYRVAVVRPLAVTGADGLTPSDAEGRALVITARELRPTDDPTAPESIRYVYDLTVHAPGFEPFRTVLDNAGAFPAPLDVTLRAL